MPNFFHCNSRRWSQTASLILALVLFAGAGFAQTPRVLTTLPAGLYLEAQPLKFDGLISGAAWSVRDWQARVVAQGTQGGGTALTLPALPIGYYKLTVLQSGKTFNLPFGVVTNPAGRTADPKSPYALDSAQAWHSESVAGRDLVAAAELARLAGVPQVRDRFSWKDTNAVRGQYNWGRYANSIQALAARGVDVLNVFSGAPPWTRTTADDMPNDLLALHDFARAAGRQFPASVSAWEFWNEPDLDTCRDPAWEFAAAQKAAYLGFKAGAPKARVLIGSNAVHPTTRFLELALENGAGAGFDIYNVHLYGSENGYPSIIAEKERLLARFGRANTPIWATEIGTAKEETGGAAPLVGNNREHTEAQERTQAEHVVKSLVTLHAENVQRSFYFLLLPYNERNGQKPWGLLRWNWTVKPGYLALAHLTSVLADHEFIALVTLPGVEAYLFEKRGQPAATRKQTVVFWAANQPVSVAANWARNARLTDLMGAPRTLALNASGQPLLQAGTSPQFLTNVTPLAAPLASPPPPPPPAIQPVVLGFSLNDPSIIVNRTALNLPATPVAGTLKVWNFSDQSRSVALVNASAGVQLGTLPATVALQPRQVVSVPLSIARSAASAPRPQIKISGTSGGIPVSPLVVPMRPNADSFNQTRVAISNTGLWRANSSGTLSMLGNAAANTMRFTVNFRPGTEWWVYPAFKVKTAGVQLAGSAGLAFDIRADTVPVNVDLSYCIVKTTNAWGNTKLFKFPFYLSNSWQTVTLLWDYDAPEDLVEANAVEIQIGANPAQAQLIYTVREMKILTAKP